MNQRGHISCAVMAACALTWFATPMAAPQSFPQRFFAHNSEMTRLQPSFVTPLVSADPRIIQYARFAVSSEFTPQDTRTVSFGNSRGAGLIAFRRFEFDWLPPSYIEHHSAAKDGAGDTSVAAKYRIVSANAEHGNFEFSALLNRCFPTGSHSNGAATGTWTPTVAAGYAFLRHYDVISTLGGTLPTGKIEQQGRTIAWNALVQVHIMPHLWVEAENNANFYFAGNHDGRMQNFATPAAFFVVRRKQWNPTHPYAIAGGGMQIATSHFHTCNHNLIADVRLIF